jgi:hypothetical protein
LILLLSTKTLSPVEAVPINCHVDCTVLSTDGDGDKETNGEGDVETDGKGDTVNLLTTGEGATDVEGSGGKNLSQFVIKATPTVPNSPMRARIIWVRESFLVSSISSSPSKSTTFFLKSA